MVTDSSRVIINEEKIKISPWDAPRFANLMHVQYSFIDLDRGTQPQNPER
jgi:hypothetical protein